MSQALGSSPLPAPIPDGISCPQDQLCLLGLLPMEESSSWLPYTTLHPQTNMSKIKHFIFPWGTWSAEFLSGLMGTPPSQAL